MGNEELLTPEEHQRQIQAYAKEFPAYRKYAEVLKRVFENACRISFPEALVQSRPKTLSSFAEKVARKYGKYRNAVEDMTDLCGARVIVQTTEQVLAVRQFIQANFEILEADDKALLLSEDKFGYRDMHYIVQLRPDRDDVLGITRAEHRKIDGRKAEIQVRSWVQHAWADTLHDRIYKNPLKLSADIMRTGALLSALLEESDRTFKCLADDLDGLIANYTASAKRKDVEEEISIQELVLGNEPDDTKKPILAMKLAKLALACGDDARVVEVLEPHSDALDANRSELLSDLGYALCRMKRNEPSSPEYTRGREFLEESLRICECEDVPFVPHLRKHESLHARALSRLGWALEVMEDKEYEARKLLQKAHQHEPANPYYLANMLGSEIYCSRRTDLSDSMTTTIREAIKTCRKHAVAGIELPWSFFTAGRLNVLLRSPHDALGYYARGIRHCLAGTHCVPKDALDNETQWLRRIHFGVQTPTETRCVINLLDLGRKAGRDAEPASAEPRIKSPVLIVAGGAKSIDDRTLDGTRPLLEESLKDFQGTVIAGGTTVGVPGCVGDVARQLAQKKQKRFQLVGYGPEKLPRGVLGHEHYDHTVHVGDGFQPEQILRNWDDIFASGIDPSSVMLLGIGGGPLSAVEYRIALALGASVGIVTGTGGTAEILLGDDLWSGLEKLKLYPLLLDDKMVRAFVIPPQREFEKDVELAMARSFHEDYLEESKGRLAADLRHWDELDETYKTANCEQARYAVAILEAAGFGVRKVEGTPVIFDDFTEDEVDGMAQLEHGRWYVERLRDGWRYGKLRDNANRIHDSLVPWGKLSENARLNNRTAVCAYPRILAKADMEVFRKGAAEEE